MKIPHQGSSVVVVQKSFEVNIPMFLRKDDDTQFI